MAGIPPLTLILLKNSIPPTCSAFSNSSAVKACRRLSDLVAFSLAGYYPEAVIPSAPIFRVTFPGIFFKKDWNRPGEGFHGPVRFSRGRGSACPALPGNFRIPDMRKLFFLLVVFCLWTAVAQAAPVVDETAVGNEPPASVETGAEDAVAPHAIVGSQVADLLEIMARHPLSPKGLGCRAAQIALDFLGVKYRWGGMSRETGMDCSGFVKSVYALCGVDLPRTSAEQFRQGQAVAPGELSAGDLVFFGRNHRVRHVGIYLGEGKFIHAPQSRETIRISSLEERSALRGFLGARRLLFDQ
jgi:hypothetical protein